MIRFGNWNNGSNDGLWYVNGNYTPSNANINVSDRDNLLKNEALPIPAKAKIAQVRTTGRQEYSKADAAECKGCLL